MKMVPERHLFALLLLEESLLFLLGQLSGDGGVVAGGGGGLASWTIHQILIDVLDSGLLALKKSPVSHNLGIQSQLGIHQFLQLHDLGCQLGAKVTDLSLKSSPFSGPCLFR